jgi:hypothetical protein
VVLEYIHLLFYSLEETVERLFMDVFFCVVNSFLTGTVDGAGESTAFAENTWMWCPSHGFIMTSLSSVSHSQQHMGFGNFVGYLLSCTLPLQMTDRPGRSYHHRVRDKHYKVTDEDRGQRNSFKCRNHIAQGLDDP